MRTGTEGTAEHSEIGSVWAKGERDSQDDRFLVIEEGDDWLMAVADDVSGTACPGTASTAAIESLKSRDSLITSREEMTEAFTAANKAVCDASDARPQYDYVNLGNAEITTLLIACSTETGGLHVGWMGDSLPFAIPLKGDCGGWAGQPSHEGLSCPDQDHNSSVSHYRSSISWWPGGYRPEVEPTCLPMEEVVKYKTGPMIAAQHNDGIHDEWCHDGCGQYCGDSKEIHWNDRNGPMAPVGNEFLLVLSTDGLYPLMHHYGPIDHGGKCSRRTDQSARCDSRYCHALCDGIGYAVPQELRTDPHAALSHMMTLARPLGLSDNIAATAAVVRL